MNELSKFTLRVLRKLYGKTIGSYQFPPLLCERDLDKASELIYNLLAKEKPCMVARFGATELSVIVNYLGVKSSHHNAWKFIQGKNPEWWWNPKMLRQMEAWSGFFPSTPETVSHFSELMLEDTGVVDVLGSWQPMECYLEPYYNNVRLVEFEAMNPFWTEKPWTRALRGKKVLVIHPFASSIEKQYKENRENLFQNKDVLPEFELQTIQAVQSLGGESNGFKDWFEALHWMESEISKHDFDIALIGCGAYGFPLAAYVKRMGKKAVHMGGSLQLLFGIRGKRWEDPNYNSRYNYAALMNEFWVKPEKKEMPVSANRVEGGCYW